MASVKKRRAGTCQSFIFPSWEQDNEFEGKLPTAKKSRDVGWITLDGEPNQEGGDGWQVMNEVLKNEDLETSLLSKVRFRDPDKFVAGGVHNKLASWQRVLEDHPKRELIIRWIRDGIDVEKFRQRFCGTFKGVSYDCDLPLPRVFRNHASCKKFSGFIGETILKRLSTGAVKVWGRVNCDEPPSIILPLTVEPSKPRLCIDGRYVNLWMRDSPFSLDKLIDVTRYAYRDSYVTKCDDKSGYDHVFLQQESHRYFGFQWSGWWFVCTTLPFGWKESPYIYHTIGLAASGYLRSCGVPCSLYIDDRLNGELVTASGPWSVPISERSGEFRLAAATAAILITASLLIELGYTIGLSKSVLLPSKRVEYLGFIVDTAKQTFEIPSKKVASFATLREEILSCKKSVNMKSLQRFQGKCVSLSLAVPAAKLYIRNMSAAIASCSGEGQVRLTDSLREEICHWRFLDQWLGFVPWREEKHARLSLSTDASNFGWGCIVHGSGGDRSLGDYWSDQEKKLNISSKEMLAICHALDACPKHIRDCRVDLQVDSRVAIDTYYGQGSRKSHELTEVTKRLYQLVLGRNLQLELSYVPSKENEADAPSRRISAADATLSAKAWQRVECAFGGASGHTFDLMALDSNAQQDRNGFTLPHFTPCASPQSKGINLFAQDLTGSEQDLSNMYVYPPFCLIGPVLRFVSQCRRPFTIVVPGGHPRQFWWPVLMAMSCEVLCLAQEGDSDALLYPSKSGYQSRPCPMTLLACRVSRF